MIEKLTKEQELQIPKYIEKWIAKASEPIDRDKTVKIVKELFGADKTVLIAESIDNCTNIIKFIADGKNIKYDSQLHSQLDSQLFSQLYSQLDSQLSSQLYSQLDSQLGPQLHSQLYSQLRSQLDSQLRSQLDSQLDSQLHSQLDSQLGPQLYSQLDSQLYSQLRSQLDSQLHSQLDSQLYLIDINYSYYTTIWWYNWYGYYDYAKYIGVKFDEEKFQRMGDIILNIPLIVTLGQILIVIEKPKVRWNKNGFIHSDEFPAIEWTDKSGIFFLNGVRFPKELWEKIVSHSMSLKEVMAIVDIDQRTQAMKYVDVQELIKEFKGETLSTYSKFTVDGKEVSYSLVKIPKNENLFTIDSFHAVYNCPSTDKIYMSGIDPKIAEKGDIKEAMAWKGKMTVEQWQTLIPLVTES